MPSTANQLIPCLIEHGGILASLLRVAKTQPSKEKLKTIHDQVNLSIPSILKEIEDAQLPAFFSEKAIPNILEKIEATLKKLKEIDSENAGDYEQLASNVNDCKLKKQTSAVGSSSSLVSDSSPAGDSSQLEGSATAHATQQDSFERLTTDVEKKCLFCFCLFDAGIEVNKREPIHLWIALDLVVDSFAGAEMLAKLVAHGFVERTVRNNRYTMNEHVRSMVVAAMDINYAQDPSLCIMDQKKREKQQQPQQEPLKRVGLGTLVLNKREDTLQASTFERISKLKGNVKVLHLGSWLRDSERYIVVDEEIEVLKGLTKHQGEVTYLSLKGISGIVELPDSVYKLENLRVLDLRGCPNLEFLSVGINSMKHLTHLDLSECYLLDHFPKGIASLTQLRVLKGFVIDPEVGAERNGKNIPNRKQTLCASFSELKALDKLKKLTVRTRRMDFPTSDDFYTLCTMRTLTNLRIAWVWNSSNNVTSPSTSSAGWFPASLKKLELQAAPKNTMLRLLSLVSNDTRISLQKFYIRGGQLWDLGIHDFRHVQTVRLRYLPELRINWNEFRDFFPNLTQLEVLDCPNLICFPCDENGNWKRH